MIDLVLDTEWMDLWFEGDWWTALFEPYFQLVGEPGVLLIVGAPTTIAFWIQTGSIYTPAALLALFAGFLLAGAPPAATIVGYLLIVVAIMFSYRSIFNGRSA